ncbi:carbohydrate ABC transporter permease [Marinibacterium profundimaris]|uniref:carbohydrate ABC transporter permease n=1 Tax=Marinibacterium profundimaris TaxID=1679460 RepID=UPI0018E9D361|nr:sugar ABC transporter permease [Marinibacterium profundimaris]
MATNSTRRRNALWRIGSLLPASLLLVALSIYPVFNLVGLSLSDVEWIDGRAHSEFIGFANFDQLFRHETVYWAGVRNTIIFAICAVTAQMIFGFSMALAARRASGVTRAVLTAVFLLPIVMPPIVIGAMWRLLLGRDFGAVNTLLGYVGIGPIDFLGNPDIALASVILVDIWHWTPFVFLLMLTGLESLDQEVFEAAKFDVRSPWQELRYVTIPLMVPTILITLGLRLVLSFKVFDEVYLLTGGGPGTSTEVINFSIYRTFFAQDRLGVGSAMSLLTLVAVAVLIVVVNLWIRKRRSKSQEATS